MEASLIDSQTARALSQILPVLLLAIMIELRRTRMHLRGRSVLRTRITIAALFGAFAVIETLLVLSVDGHVLPARWSDLAAASIIFGLLWLLFVLSMMPDPRDAQSPSEE
ncbi:hypothetical protein [Plantibacter sp. YIM 135249]|uniref:hypothetical protein n=1 Tax=Plantibacter sp. YIM 135249 TaxID=3423918 RepID=UPI003D341414